MSGMFDGPNGKTTCRSCGAEILWVHTERGKKMPLDAEPYTGDKPSGLFVRRWDHALDVAVAIATTPDAFPGEPLYTSHFATCPDADRWRNRTGGRA